MADYVRTYHYKLDDGVNEGKLQALDALYSACNIPIIALKMAASTSKSTLNKVNKLINTP